MRLNELFLIVTTLSCVKSWNRHGKPKKTVPKYPCTAMGVQWVRHPVNCSVYFVCGHGIPYHMPPCPAQRVWSNQFKNCVPVRSRWDDCPYMTKPTKPQSKATQQDNTRRTTVRWTRRPSLSTMSSNDRVSIWNRRTTKRVSMWYTRTTKRVSLRYPQTTKKVWDISTRTPNSAITRFTRTTKLSSSWYPRTTKLSSSWYPRTTRLPSSWYPRTTRKYITRFTPIPSTSKPSTTPTWFTKRLTTIKPSSERSTTTVFTTTVNENPVSTFVPHTASTTTIKTDKNVNYYSTTPMPLMRNQTSQRIIPKFSTAAVNHGKHYKLCIYNNVGLAAR